MDLIDIEEVCSVGICRDINCEKCPFFQNPGTCILRERIFKLKSVDAVPVVRCKDCIHRDPEDFKCDCGSQERQGCIFPVADDYFAKTEKGKQMHVKSDTEYVVKTGHTIDTDGNIPLKIEEELVRCKDCKHADVAYCHDHKTISKTEVYCLLLENRCKNSFYCADGERKTDEQAN